MKIRIAVAVFLFLSACSIVFDLLREMAFPAVAYYSAHAYEYCYWLSIPVEYILAFGVMWEAFRYSLGDDAKISPKALQLFLLAVIGLMGLAAVLFFHPDVSSSNVNGLVLTLDRSIDLLRCGCCYSSGYLLLG